MRFLPNFHIQFFLSAVIGLSLTLTAVPLEAGILFSKESGEEEDKPTTPAVRPTGWADLPEEVLLMIFPHFSKKEVARGALTCKR